MATSPAANSDLLGGVRSVGGDESEAAYAHQLVADAKPKKHADTHTPIHRNLGGLIWKYKWYAVAQLLCIIITFSCYAGIHPEHSNTTNSTNSSTEALMLSSSSTEAEGLTWESYWVINCVMAVVLMMLMGLPSDLVLVAVTVSLTLVPCSRSQCEAEFTSKNGSVDCSEGAWGVCTIISMEQAWAGFQSTSVLSIAVLFIVAKGVETTGIISYVAQFVLGNPKFLWLAVLRMCIPVALVSAFVNDTPVVAVMMPIIEAWALKTGTPVSKLMIPLSYAALLGGMCTLIGTSTNLVLAGLVKADPNAEKDHISVDMFEMTPVGVCVSLSCIIYMSICAKCLLPNHHVNDELLEAEAKSSEIGTDDAADGSGGAAAGAGGRNKVYSLSESIGENGGTGHSDTDRKRKFLVDVIVRPKSKLIGKAFRDTVLGTTDSISLVGLHRVGGGITASENPEEVAEGADGERGANTIIAAGDVLFLAVTLPQLVLLRSSSDVTLRRQQQITATLAAGRRYRKLFEVVVAPHNPLVGRPLRERLILALHPGAEVLAARYSPSAPPSRESEDATSDYVVRAHDTLVVESYPSFGKAFRADSAFLAVADVPASTPPRNYTTGDMVRMGISGAILVAMITGIVVDSDFVFEWAIVAAYLLIFTQCLTVTDAFKAVKGRVILGILAAMGE
jgi:di/tricarboxylate transporter